MRAHVTRDAVPVKFAIVRRCAQLAELAPRSGAASVGIVERVPDDPPLVDVPADTEAPRPRVQSVARAIGILLAIAQSENGLTTKEISERVKIGRHATYHLLHTLTSTGMVTRDDRNRHVLGLRVGTLAEGFTRQLAPSEHLAPMVRALAQETSEACYAPLVLAVSGPRDRMIAQRERYLAAMQRIANTSPTSRSAA